MLRARFGDVSGQTFGVDITISVDGVALENRTVVVTVPPETEEERRSRENYEKIDREIKTGIPHTYEPGETYRDLRGYTVEPCAVCGRVAVAHDYQEADHAD